MIIKKFYYYGDVPAHIVRFSKSLVSMPLGVAAHYISEYRTRYKVCLGGRIDETAWLSPWEGGDKWLVELECQYVVK